MSKTAAIVSVAIALGVVAIFLLFGNDSEMAPIVDQPCPAGTERVGEGCMPLKDACELRGDQYYFDEPSQKCLISTAPEKSYTSADFKWRITNASNFEEAHPFHQLAVEVGGKVYQVQGADPYQGCSVNTNWPREANELSKVVCWWGGGGHEVGVFAEGEKYLIKERWIQESGGPDVNASPNGPWKVLLEI